MTVPVPTVDDPWLADAELHITNWVAGASYRVSTTPVAVTVLQ